MPNAKQIRHPQGDKGLTSLYATIVREVDFFYLNDADGTFAANPADKFIALSEHAVIKGVYILNESRTVWNNGRYLVFVYKQAGGSPAPTVDSLEGYGELIINGDSEALVDANITTRLASVSYVAPDNAGIAAIQAEVNAHPTLAEIEASAVLAKEATIASRPTLAQIEGSVVLAKQEKLDFIKKHLINQMDIITNPNGTKTIIYYDDDNTTEIARHTFNPSLNPTTQRREKSTI